MKLGTIPTLCAMAAFMVAPSLVRGQYQIDWSTLDGGGGYSAGGAFTLDGTIGQLDAGPSPAMTGGTFEIIGGFWTVAAATCGCLADMNGDGARDGLDIGQFVACVLNGGACSCADMSGGGGVTPADVPLFVSALLAGGPCP